MSAIYRGHDLEQISVQWLDLNSTICFAISTCIVLTFLSWDTFDPILHSSKNSDDHSKGPNYFNYF